MNGFASSVLSRAHVDRAEVEPIGIGIVAVDFKDFGNETVAGTALDLNHDVERVTDICFDRSVRKLYSAL